MKRVLCLIPFLLSPAADALLIRGDVDDALYRVEATAFAPLVDMPGEGHGVLIAPSWIVSAAHVVAARPVNEVIINGQARRIREVIVHPGYTPLPKVIADAALASGDPSGVMRFLETSDDLALLHLQSPVDDVEPAVLFRGNDEAGRTVRLFGKGATGNGDTGEVPDSPHRTSLRRASNVITAADDRWISYTFDPPASALPLEGMTGGGDSGGPVLTDVDGHWMLAGVASWRHVKGDIHRVGRYGDGGNSVRISRYVGWIESVIAASAPKLAKGGTEPFDIDGMFRAWLDRAGAVHVAIHADEKTTGSLCR